VLYQLVGRRFILRERILEHRVHRSDDRLFYVPEQGKQVVAGKTAIDAVLVLDAHNIRRRPVNPLSSSPVILRIIPPDLKLDFRGVVVGFASGIEGDDLRRRLEDPVTCAH